MGAYSNPMFGGGTPATMSQGTGGVGPAQGSGRKRRSFVDQLRQAASARQIGGSNIDLLRLGGPEYLDMIDQRRMDPFATWF